MLSGRSRVVLEASWAVWKPSWVFLERLGGRKRVRPNSVAQGVDPPLGPLLGLSCGSLGRLLGLLGALLGRLGTLLGRLGAILEASWAVLDTVKAQMTYMLIEPRARFARA